MSRYTARVEWQRGNEAFIDNRYSRRHRWSFDGGLEVPASSSPHSVPVPMSDAHAVDPEEAFVASLSSCHMLWFLSLAARKRFRVERYLDEAEAVLEKNAEGKLAVTRVTLHPAVEFSGDKLPTRAELDALHHAAHAECFIASSVKSEVRCEPVY